MDDERLHAATQFFCACWVTDSAEPRQPAVGPGSVLKPAYCGIYKRSNFHIL